MAGIIPIDFLAEMTSVGTLVAFVTVSVSVMIRRRARRTCRSFRRRPYPVIPILSVLGALSIIDGGLPIVTLYVFVISIAIAFV